MLWNRLTARLPVKLFRVCIVAILLLARLAVQVSVTGSGNIEVPGPGRLDNVVDVHRDGTKAGSRWDVSGSLKVLLDLEARALRVLARHQILVAWRREFPQDWTWAVAVVLCGSHVVV